MFKDGTHALIDLSNKVNAMHYAGFAANLDLSVRMIDIEVKPGYPWDGHCREALMENKSSSQDCANAYRLQLSIKNHILKLSLLTIISPPELGTSLITLRCDLRNACLPLAIPLYRLWNPFRDELHAYIGPLESQKSRSFWDAWSRFLLQGNTIQFSWGVVGFDVGLDHPRTRRFLVIINRGEIST